MKHLHPRGLPSRLVKETGLPQPVISNILNGVRRATVAQAELLEGAFIRLGVPITRWHMLYGFEKGVPLDTHGGSFASKEAHGKKGGLSHG
jgi:hypothetical protein